MPIKILMPALSPTMTEGNLVRWLKSEGDMVKPGQVIAEIETDKATMEVEAVDEGVLAKIYVPAGTESVKVNMLIGVILEEGENESDLAALSDGAPLSVEGSASVEKAASVEKGAQASVAVDAAKPTPSASGERVFASPLARRLAEQNNVNIASIPGTGPHGRIVKADVEAAAVSGAKPATIQNSSGQAPLVYGTAGYAELPLNNMRKVIANRLTESKQQVPHFYLTVDCNLDALLKLRSDINARLEDTKISVNDFIVRATALALMKVPASNASWHDTHIRQYQAADVCVAVAIEGGLVTPVVRSAHLKSLKEISVEVKSLAERARAGKLMPEEYQGGSFTISNLGMYGINQFAAIINPPQAGIMAVGAGEQRAIVKDGQMQVATMMTCTLSADHRVVDGAVGANFLAAFKEFIEDPLRLLV
ncbi:pyruvate dehydrogenase complex dihydrolipoamide acetyltransferase [Candidatus Odyssella acanthamoebae]|uniref:Acetyltransferase component of pyruvate dehydrogenase complex n=1 Tax=Candidatus Odyssella acanthamoebae TaxID=91604 RepID=A0A077AWD7_9PROT|nr:pyruvate dehydrogenase complex dihydrolipoamide acetyltransferase [Candidatus Paracaedibacter acanthamoebae]AIK96354.1 branched-chain alpha-keto acid dehydrogenase subunit E2 [Candidatus Paracaedibacter acanthamoebae]